VGGAQEVAPERRFAEEIGRYEDFLRSAIDWLWEADAGLTLTYASSPVALKLGIPAQVLVGRALTALGRFETPGGGPGGDTGDSADRAQDAIAARRPFRDARFVMTGAEGREVAYRLSGVPYFNAATGGFAGYRGTAVAASEGPETQAAASEGAETRAAETRAAETRAGGDDEAIRVLAETLEESLVRQQDLSWRLSQAQTKPKAPAPIGAAPEEAAPEEAAPKEAAAVEVMGDNPLARTAHELRTPLNAVVGYADLALKQMFGPLGERYLDCFRTIREAGRHLDHLVSHLQASRPAAAEAALAAEIVEVSGVAAKAKAMIALAARDAEVDISRVGPMAGGRVLGDATACTQILVNLLSNAVKFTPAGGSVGLETLVGSDSMLRIAVWDTGIGIPGDEQARIFEDSYRVTAVAGGGGPTGLGLGLAISRDLARAMGGDITVSSQPGQGARFILSLPLGNGPAAGP
jgi:signal transduction histidine kinase